MAQPLVLTGLYQPKFLNYANKKINSKDNPVFLSYYQSAYLAPVLSLTAMSATAVLILTITKSFPDTTFARAKSRSGFRRPITKYLNL